jgi:hypothetical protein
VTIGEIRIEGLKRVHEKLVRHRLTLRSGQQFSSKAIEAARRDLLALGPFAAINVEVGNAVDHTGGVPVTFDFRERKRHAVSLSAAYSTDLGGSGGVSWTDRNVFGNAEQLKISANVLNLGGSASSGIGYDTSAKFTIPDFHHRDQSLQITVGALNQSLVAYDQRAVTSSVTLNRKLSTVWTVSVGVATAEEKILQEEVNYNYTLVSVPLNVSYDSTNLASPLDDPVHGIRAGLSLTPTVSLGRPDAVEPVSSSPGTTVAPITHIAIGIRRSSGPCQCDFHHHSDQSIGLFRSQRTGIDQPGTLGTCGSRSSGSWLWGRVSSACRPINASTAAAAVPFAVTNTRASDRYSPIRILSEAFLFLPARSRCANDSAPVGVRQPSLTVGRWALH